MTHIAPRRRWTTWFLSTLVLAFLIWRIGYVNVEVIAKENGGDAWPLADRQWFVDLIRKNPGDIGAWLMLGREAEGVGNAGQADVAYRRALLFAPVDRQVLAEVADYELRRNRLNDAAYLFARLAQLYPTVRDDAFVKLSRLFEHDPRLPAWRELASSDLPWMDDFIQSACYRNVDPVVLAPLFLQRIRVNMHRPEESACIVRHLRDSGRWTDSYQLWLNVLPIVRLKNVGYLFNGSFEYAPEPTGYDWMLDPEGIRETGHLAEIADDGAIDGRFVLRIRYGGRPQQGIPVKQMLVLRPGEYEVSGYVRSAFRDNTRAVQWVVHCVESNAEPVLAKSDRFVGSAPWREFSFGLTVPVDCPGQYMDVEPGGTTLSAQFLDGTIWFDALKIRRREP